MRVTGLKLTKVLVDGVDQTDGVIDAIPDAEAREHARGFRRYLAIAGPARSAEDRTRFDAARAGLAPWPCALVTRLPWPWLDYALGKTGPPPKLWWLDDPADDWQGADQA